MADDLVTLRTFNGTVEAEIARGKLEVNGIASYVSADDAGGIGPAFQTVEGVRLIVRSEDFERATQLLDENDEHEATEKHRRQRRQRGI